jgi:hypothetical protein
MPDCSTPTVIQQAGARRWRRWRPGPPCSSAGSCCISPAASRSGARNRLKALGLRGGVIQWRLRLFLPVSDQGPAVLAALLAQHPQTRAVAATPAAA